MDLDQLALKPTDLDLYCLQNMNILGLPWYRPLENKIKEAMFKQLEQLRKIYQVVCYMWTTNFCSMLYFSLLQTGTCMKKFCNIYS